MEHDYSKRYWLICYNNYYPGGGLNDVYGTFDAVEDGKEHFHELRESNEEYVPNDVVQIFDKEKNEYVWNYWDEVL